MGHMAIGEKVVKCEVINKHKEQRDSLGKEVWDMDTIGQNKLDQHGQTETSNRRDMVT